MVTTIKGSFYTDLFSSQPAEPNANPWNWVAGPNTGAIPEQPDDAQDDPETDAGQEGLGKLMPLPSSLLYWAQMTRL
jgi:hypothetical protein